MRTLTVTYTGRKVLIEKKLVMKQMRAPILISARIKYIYIILYCLASRFFVINKTYFKPELLLN